MFDVIIIGAGITGSLIAYNLSKYDLKVFLLEKNSDVAEGATGANSAMVHSGHDPKPGTLKCKYNLLGNRMFPDLCKELKVPFKQIGAYVVATSSEEENNLEVLIKQCEERKIPFEVLDGDTARISEPNLSDNVTKALSLPTTGIINPWLTSMAACENAMLNGVELKLNYEVKSIKKNNTFIINDELETKILINCAGAHCDDITNMLTTSPYKVETKKGEYYVLDHITNYVNHVIYPVPSNKGKGVLAIPTVDDNVLLGPNSDFIEDKDNVSTGDGLDYVKKEITKTMKNIPYYKMIHTFAGLRPHINLNDFYIQEDEHIENFIHVAGIESPGLTSAPAIAKDVVENIVIRKLNPDVKKEYVYREAYKCMKDMSDDEKAELIKKDPDYGKIICRCEKISLGEIKDAINRKCGATTIKGVKMRCRPGMGRCQGGFCEPEVVKILAKELNKSIEDIRLDKVNSNVYISKAKENL